MCGKQSNATHQTRVCQCNWYLISVFESKWIVIVSVYVCGGGGTQKNPHTTCTYNFAASSARSRFLWHFSQHSHIHCFYTIDRFATNRAGWFISCGFPALFNTIFTEPYWKFFFKLFVNKLVKMNLTLTFSKLSARVFNIVYTGFQRGGTRHVHPPWNHHCLGFMTSSWKYIANYQPPCCLVTIP